MCLKHIPLCFPNISGVIASTIYKKKKNLFMRWKKKKLFFFTCTPVMEFRKFYIELLLKWILNVFTLSASSDSYFINYIHAQRLQMGSVFLRICVLSILLMLMMSSRNVTRIFTSVFFWHLRIFYLIPHWLACGFNDFF